MIEGIIRCMPDSTSDVMETAFKARRIYTAALPSPDDPPPLEFDESRDVGLRIAAERQFLVDWAAACAKLTPDGAIGGWSVPTHP